MLESDALSRLRDHIATLQVLPCRLAHEQVILEHGIAQRRSQGLGVESAFVRVGLCPSDLRSHQLSCAHTTARNVLEHAITRLSEAALLSHDDARQLSADLHRISNSIHETDWHKNEAEVRYALLVEQGTASGSTSSALLKEKQHLASLVDRHQESAKELQRIHALVLARLDSALGEISRQG